MKLVTYDETYPVALGGSGVYLSSSDGSNTGAGGPDITGSPGELTVTGLRGSVSLASNLATGVALGDTLTIIQTSPAVARFATPSNSYGSNSTRVSSLAAVGAASSLSRSDHIHDGIGTVTASSSNTMARGTLNLRAGENVAFGLTDSDGDGAVDTITVSSTGGGTGTGTPAEIAPASLVLAYNLFR